MRKFDPFNLVVLGVGLLPVILCAGYLYAVVHFLVKFW